jgi:hypothetical protein
LSSPLAAIIMAAQPPPGPPGVEVKVLDPQRVGGKIQARPPLAKYR